MFVFPPKQKFDCTSCGDCCRNWPVPLSDHDIATLDAVDWKSVAPGYESFHVSTKLIGSSEVRVLIQDQQRACLFLNEDNRCGIHAKFGSDKKPIACQLFPFHFVEGPPNEKQRTYLSLQFFCKGLAAGQGRPISKHKKDLEPLRKLVDKHFALTRTPETLAFNQERVYQSKAINTLIDHLGMAINEPKLPLSKRLLTLTRFIDLIAASNFSSLQDPKRLDMIDKFYKGTLNQVRKGLVSAPRGSPSFPERILFKQLLGFRTLPHTPLLPGVGAFRLAGTSLSRFIHGFYWMCGGGTIHFRKNTIKLRRVLREAPKNQLDDEPAQEVIIRYLSAALSGRKLFESGLRRRAFMPAVGLLLRQIPALMLFARAFALLRESAKVESEDYYQALRLTDLSFGLFPVAGGPLGKVRRRQLMDMKGPWYHLSWCCGRDDAY